MYKVNDKVVYVDDFMPPEVMTISKVEDGSVCMDDGSKACHCLDMLQLASADEINQGIRLEESWT